METFFETDYAKISHDRKYHHIVCEWLIPPTQQEFVDGCNKLVDAMIHFKTGKTVIDARQQGAIHPELLQWMTTDWAKRAIEAGYSHAALIVPEDLFARMSLDEVSGSDLLRDKRNIYFDSMKQALEWIKMQ